MLFQTQLSRDGSLETVPLETVDSELEGQELSPLTAVGNVII